jgi:SAM-dependent methyltransferase
MNALNVKPVVTCSVCCTAGARAGVPEIVSVPSNVRRFQGKAFPVWRCRDCGSIHAAREVDLNAAYQNYPFHAEPRLDWRLRLLYRNQLRRLKAAGLKRDMRILDYGCGSGAFVAYLKLRGYAQAVGFDRFNPDFSSPSVLWPRFDMIVAQDVIEHTANVVGFMRDLTRLLIPGGVLVIGTPDAAAIDLGAPAAFVHTLHQPFHRKILSLRALLVLGYRNGLTLERLYRTMYVNTRVPFLNERFMAHYVQCADNTLDAAFETIRVTQRRLWTWKALFLAFFGSFFSRKTDVTAVFRRADGLAPAADRARR